MMPPVLQFALSTQCTSVFEQDCGGEKKPMVYWQFPHFQPLSDREHAVELVPGFVLQVEHGGFLSKTQSLPM